MIVGGWLTEKAKVQLLPQSFLPRPCMLFNNLSGAGFKNGFPQTAPLGTPRAGVEIMGPTAGGWVGGHFWR
jgi:hypothetical protein